jgi:HSP20 family protein
MNITRYTPFRDFESFLSNWRSPFEAGDWEGLKGARWMPSVDIEETDKEFLLKVEVPEVKKEDLHIEVDHGVLTIRGERQEEKETENKKLHRVERFYGSFERSFTLPENVREENIEAEQKDGMLYLHLRKSDITRSPRKLDIRAA